MNWSSVNPSDDSPGPAPSTPGTASAAASRRPRRSPIVGRRSISWGKPSSTTLTSSSRAQWSSASAMSRAPRVSSSCPRVRTPMIVDVTAGSSSVHASATWAGVRPTSSATSRTTSAMTRPRSDSAPVAAATFLRLPSIDEVATPVDVGVEFEHARGQGGREVMASPMATATSTGEHSGHEDHPHSASGHPRTRPLVVRCSTSHRRRIPGQVRRLAHHGHAERLRDLDRGSLRTAHHGSLTTIRSASHCSG